ncbi:MAG: heavy metal translocating P-type ATPase metal-binding domain-containing protein, partial [Bacteroidales bacterium]|nr:heavy metal translocating P-type ATPase metal-binding domain-containing protein [Bacteroidales bacterium]
MADTIPCIHCGADCGKNPVVWDGKNFCCHGCEQVYRIINERNLSGYYKIENTPGLRVDSPAHDSKYGYLDKEEVQQKLYIFQEDDLVRVKLYIPGIHCASCIWLLEQLTRLNPGIKQSSVNFINKELTVNFITTEISLRQVVELLASIHYVPEISLQSLEHKDNSKFNKKLLYKIGVAGFVFGNVMLYSLPEYFNKEPLDGSFGTFLHYISFILTVPLVFYSGSDYLVSAFKNLRRGIINVDLPIALGLLALFSVTSYEVISGTGPGYSDSLSGFLFFLLIGKWYQSKTYQALSFDRDYKSYFPVAVTRISNQTEESVLLKDISEGDELLIRNKELIPADAELIEGTALIDYSFVSGESRPVRKKVGDPVYAGGIQTSGAIRIRLIRDVEQSHLTQLWNQPSNDSGSSNKLVSIIDKISVWFTLSIIIIALSGFSYWLFISDLKSAILVLTSVLIVACPCALALSLPFTLGSAMRILGHRGMYMKNTDVIQKLRKISTIVFDKTGTLTKPDENEIKYQGEALSEDDHNAVFSLSRQSIHPLSHALSQQNNDTDILPIEGFVEVAGRGIFGRVQGRDIRLGSAEFAGSATPLEKSLSSRVYLSIDSNIKGFFTISNTYREGFHSVVSSLNEQYDLYLLSGDNDSERQHLSKYFKDKNLHFNQQPADKMSFISSLREKGHHVMMIGDGLNDAG